MRAGPATGRVVGCMRSPGSSSRAGSAKKSLFRRPNRSSPGSSRWAWPSVSDSSFAHELVDEIRALDAKLRRSKARITTAVVASATTVTDLYGVGPIVAATVIGYSGDVRRFPTAGHYAAYNGTAPIELSSAGRTVHRLSRRGNRVLNHAIHMAAVTQIRNLPSEGRAYYDTKVAAGKTKREAMRALKRRLSDRVYRQLLADTRPR